LTNYTNRLIRFVNRYARLICFDIFIGKAAGMGNEADNGKSPAVLTIASWVLFIEWESQLHAHLPA